MAARSIDIGSGLPPEGVADARVQMDWNSIWLVMHLSAAIAAMVAITVLHLYVHQAFWCPKYAPPSSAILHAFSVFIWTDLLLMVVSGTGLFLDRPEEFLRSQKFQAKALIVLILILNGALLNLWVMPRVQRLHKHDWLQRSEKFSKVMRIAIPAGVVSMTSWWGAFILGIAGGQEWSLIHTFSVYLGIIALGTATGLVIADPRAAERVRASLLRGLTSSQAWHLWRLGRYSRSEAMDAETLLQRCPVLLDEAREAVVRRNSKRLRRAARSLRTALASLSDGAACEMALKLEMVGYAGDFSHAREAYLALEAEFERLRTALGRGLDGSIRDVKVVERGNTR